MSRERANKKIFLGTITKALKDDWWKNNSYYATGTNYPWPVRESLLTSKPKCLPYLPYVHQMAMQKADDRECLTRNSPL
ncbi:hypothetical protein AVEN_245499-1, partial [Araneus ventricosus]